MIIEAKGTQDNIIGRLGENLAIRVEFHVGNVLREHPDAVFTVLHKRPGDENAYPVSPSKLELDGNSLYWTIQSGDVEKVGVGECEVAAYEDEAIIKSTIYRTKILPALDDSGEVPDPWESWVGDVTQAAASAIAAQEAAEEARDEYPYINEETGTWMVWDPEEGEYVDTGSSAVPDVIRVQDTQPTDADSMIWFPETKPAAVQVPTVEEMNAALATKYVKPTGGIPASDIASGVIPDVSGLYTKPVTGIPATDMASAVQASLGAADTAYQKPAGGIPATDIASGVIPDPEDLIDDTAGDGDTDKVWSADKSADVTNSLNSAINAKYEKPSGGIPASDLASGVIPSVPVQDVQVNGVSVLSQGVANVPVASDNTAGVLKIVDSTYGLQMVNGVLRLRPAWVSNTKAGTNEFYPISPATQHAAAFYGLAKAASADMASLSSVTVGQYPEAQKSAISQMLDAPETVSGTTPSVTGKAGIRYVCGTVSTLTITPPASGDCEVIFTSGSTATVLTVSNTVKFPEWFDATSLEANRTYDIIITNATYGVVTSWAV